MEDKAQGLDVPNEKPTLVSMIGLPKMASFLGVKKCGEGMVDAIKVDGLPQNPDFADFIIRSKNKYAQDDKGKNIMCLFNKDKDWKKNLKKRVRVVQEVVSWHNNLSIMNTYVILLTSLPFQYVYSILMKYILFSTILTSSLFHFLLILRYKEGKAKWLERYLACEKDLYSMRNVLYMDRIATACTIYRGEHMEHLDD